MKLLMENLPSALQGQRDARARCLEAMPVRAVYLFGSHAAWPAGVAGHSGIRHRFRLPLDRPFTA